MDSDRVGEAAAIPVVRDTILMEYADGDLAVRIKIAESDVDAFWHGFPEQPQAVFLARIDGQGSIQATRGPLAREYADGSLAVKLLIGPADKREFRRLWPRPGAAAVLVAESPDSQRQRMVDAQAAAEPPAEYGQHAQKLRKHPAFMLARRVWEAVGSDDDYLGYIRTLKCARCKWVPHWAGDSFVSCEAAHVRRVASGAGTSFKPSFSAIPLCPTRDAGKTEGCHAAQHREGEGFLGGRERVDKLRLFYVQEWVWSSLKAQLGYESWKYVPPATLRAWAQEHGLEDCLPDEYLEAA